MTFSPKQQGDTQPTQISLVTTAGAVFPLTGASIGNGANGNGSFTAYLRDLVQQIDITLNGTWSGLNISGGQVTYNWVPGDTSQLNPGPYQFFVKIVIGSVVYIPRPAILLIQAS